MTTTPYYSQGFQKSVLDTHAWRTVANATPFIIPYLKKNQSLLDVGCGPGLILIDLAKYVGKVTGVDYSAGVIDVAKETLAGEGKDIKSRVSFSVASIYELPFEDNLFDVVFSHQCVVHLTDAVAGIKELIRVCKPGGYVLVQDGDFKLFTVYPEKYFEPILYFYETLIASSLKVAGRILKSNFLDAGAKEDGIEFTFSGWNINSPERRRQWADLTINRIKTSGEVEYEKDKKNLDKVIETLEEWAQDPKGAFLLPMGDLAYKKS